MPRSRCCADARAAEALAVSHASGISIGQVRRADVSPARSFGRVGSGPRVWEHIPLWFRSARSSRRHRGASCPLAVLASHPPPAPPVRAAPRGLQFLHGDRPPDAPFRAREERHAFGALPPAAPGCAGPLASATTSSRARPSRLDHIPRRIPWSSPGVAPTVGEGARTVVRAGRGTVGPPPPSGSLRHGPRTRIAGVFPQAGRRAAVGLLVSEPRRPRTGLRVDACRGRHADGG
jgi:hypothetical protein